MLCISVNGKENLSPQDKKGVEVSDDPLRRLRQSTKLKSSSCISFLGAIGIISPFSRTSRSPCPLPNSVPASLQAAGKSCQSPVLCRGPAEAAWCLLGVRTAVPVAGEAPVHAWNPAQGVPWSMPLSPGEAGASWCALTPPATAGPKDLTYPCTERCAFPSSISALQKGPSGFGDARWGGTQGHDKPCSRPRKRGWSVSSDVQGQDMGEWLHQGRFRLDIRKRFFTERVVRPERWLMPSACQCSRGVWTVPLITSFYFRADGADYHCRSLPTEIFSSISEPVSKQT